MTVITHRHYPDYVRPKRSLLFNRMAWADEYEDDHALANWHCKQRRNDEARARRKYVYWIHPQTQRFVQSWLKINASHRRLRQNGYITLSEWFNPSEATGIRV